MPATLPSRPILDTAQLWRGRPDSYAVAASGGDWHPFRWLQYISLIIAETICAGNGRLIINAPPQHGKSLLFSGYVPPWYLDLFPAHRVIFSTHTAGYAAYWGRHCRNRIRDFPHAIARVRDDSSAADEWETTQGGGMVGAGIGGALSGRPGELILIDDPIPDWDHAYSVAYRQTCIEWFDSVLYPRRQPNTTIILLQTRWHPDDLVGYLTTRHPDTWRQIVLPAIAETNDPLGRQPGEALCPERFTVASLQSNMGNPAVWSALYQQNPKHVGVGLAYESFGPGNLDPAIKLHRDRPVHISLDFNINPGMHCEIGQYDEDADLFTVRHEIHGPGMSLKQCLPSMWNVIESYGPGYFTELQVYGDASGGAKSPKDGQSCWDMVQKFLLEKQAKFSLRVPKANPGIRDRVDTLNEALNENSRIHYRIHPDCKRLREDFERLRRNEDGLPDKLADSTLSHGSDAEGYRCFRLRPIKRAAVNQAQRAQALPWHAVDVFGS